ncbi:MAG: thiolase family protein, partial [Ignavibacteriaceae bacterium]|nr:thiolase family protein [Ignavibacteriaceae bacterium]
MREAYIVAGYRSAIAKAKKGGFRFYRPDDLAADVINHLLKSVPELDPHRVDDLIVGNAFPEAEQGLQVGRMIALQCLPQEVPGVTINRFCASGIDSIATGIARIQSGMMDCVIAGGIESMSMVPMTGWKLAPNYQIAKDYPSYYMGMGLTAEKIVEKYKISREDQDEFAYNSHIKAINAIDKGYFKDQIVPVEIQDVHLENGKRIENKFVVDTDEGPRADTTLEALAKLKPVFENNGTVTAGNSSQTSDGAAFVLVMSEEMVNELKLKPIARLVSYALSGVDPTIMGTGPIEAVPKALTKANMKKEDVEVIELNEAFASQALACIRAWGLDDEDPRLNPNGGAISIGHPLGVTGARVAYSAALELKETGKRYALITMCVGVGQG